MPTFHWKDAIVFSDIRHVTVEKLPPLVASVPDARLVLHVGGSPCPCLCRWNPYSAGRQRHESEDLLVELRRVTGCLRTAFASAVVEECEENVASMALETCDGVTEYFGLRHRIVSTRGGGCLRTSTCFQH